MDQRIQWEPGIAGQEKPCKGNRRLIGKKIERTIPTERTIPVGPSVELHRVPARQEDEQR